MAFLTLSQSDEFYVPSLSDTKCSLILLRTLVPEAGISCRDKLLHPTVFCVMQLLILAWNTCFWHQCPHMRNHTMDMLWEKFQWILPLYMKPISFQSKASVVCSVTAAIFIDFCLKKLNVFSQHFGQKTNEYLNSTEQIHRNWNVDQLSMLITSKDIILWCSINLLWKELMVRLSEHTGLISPYQLLIIAACTNTGG